MNEASRQTPLKGTSKALPPMEMTAEAPRLTEATSSEDLGAAKSSTKTNCKSHLADLLPIERKWSPDHEAMRAALRVVLGMLRQPIVLDREGENIDAAQPRGFAQDKQPEESG